jgi:hypothetical protein
MAFLFYKKIGIIKSNNITIGNFNRNNPTKSINEIKQLKGESIWLVFSHVYPFFTTTNEESFIIDYFKLKHKLLFEKKEFGSSIYLIKN